MSYPSSRPTTSGTDKITDLPADAPLRQRKRGNSSASRVNIDHFDPQGVDQLRRTLTNQSQQYQPPRTADSQDSAGTIVGQADSEKFDFEITLRDLVKKRDETDIKSRELGVMFQNLRVVGLGSTATYQPTFGSMINPIVGISEGIRNARHPAVRDILSNFEGVVRPGEMLLVLGRPGSGCSTLLKTLSNQREEYHAVEGEVMYDAFTPSDIQNRYRGDVTYCPEDDVHFPTLTVAQTLSFASKTRAPQTRITGTSRTQFTDSMTDMLTTIFGLRHAKNTQVGDAAIRGVSGGEKKRVSIAEALATRSLIGAWDNSTRGLDASTALEFVRALRIATDVTRVTTIVSIYQAGESLYEHFDKVCLISEGKMVYFGRADQARDYFLEMGYEPHDRQTTADYLVSVTDPNGRHARAGYESRVPRTSEEMAAYFDRSSTAHDNREEIKAYRQEHSGNQDKKLAYKTSAKQERARHTRGGSPYTISIPMQVRAVMLRRVQIIMGDINSQAIQVMSFVFQAIIMGTIFLDSKEETSAYFSRGGVLFFSLLFGALSAMAEIATLFAQRPIVNRHKKAAMYHPFIEAVALTLVDIPITVITQALFSLILYFLVGLQKSAQQFFIFFMFIVLQTVTMKAFFRGLAAAFTQESGATALAGIMTLAISIYTGYTIPVPSMIGALKWLSYINPLKYGFEAILSNEFHTLNGTCSNLVPSGAGYEGVSLANQVCTTVGSVPGVPTVDGNAFIAISYGYKYSNLWKNLGITFAFLFAFLLVLFYFSEVNTSSASENAVTFYKRGSKQAPVQQRKEADDEEKKSASPSTENDADRKEKPAADSAVLKMDNIFSWQNLKYVVPIDARPGEASTRQLLDNVSGYVAPGKLTALMGESGAGKTTLLNILADRYSTGVVTGDRLVNGQALPSDFQAQTGYCQQMDTHMPETTVREALLFSAKLRQPASVPLAEKEAYVEVCLEMCGLTAHADAIVGSLGVEHRKRTTIGVELAAKPQLLLFLDEPTSGLDSQSAWAIMRFLRELADRGQAILCTIHQPSGELFQIFDRLLLLRKGGQTVYFGDLGEGSRDLIGYFERNGAEPCKPEANPAEWMLDVIGAGATASSVIDWHSVWKSSPESGYLQTQIETICTEGRKRPAIQTTKHSEYSTSWMFQFLTLTQRGFSAYWRNPTYIFAKLVLNVFGGLFIGFTFYNSKNTIQGTQNKLFAFFMSTILSVPLSNQLQSVYIDIRNVYEIRERPSRIYSWTALVSSQLAIELPWNILGSSLTFFCLFWTVGFSSDRAGYTYLLYGVLFPMYYTTIAQAVASMASNAALAAILFSSLFSFVIAFNGVLQPFRQLGWWQWMYRLSPFTYVIEGLVGQALGEVPIVCAPQEYSLLNPPSGRTCGDYMQQFISAKGGYLTNPEATSDCQFCAYKTSGEFLSNNFNIEYSHRWRNIGLICAFILFNIFATFALTYIFRIRTGSTLGNLKSKIDAKIAARKSAKQELPN